MKVVLLDGRHGGESCSVFDVLLSELHARGAKVEVFRLRDLNMGSCIGCFNCWLKTPGICVEADEGRNIAQAVLESDTTILLSPVTFGGYSSEIKKVQDRWIPLILPDFGIYHGEIHHKPRYSRYPRWVGIGIQDQPNEEEARIFKVLVGRNALNFHAPSYAADVVLISDSNKNLSTKVQRLLEQEDAFPLGKAITSIMPPAIQTDEPTARPSDQSRRALLIVGSPKISSPSTSGVLGGYVIKQLEERGWETASLTLRRTLLKDKGRAELLAAANKADLIVLAFPLYIDSLPFLLMRALETMAEQPHDEGGLSQKGLVAIVNNGFAESYQNAVAVAICRQFATSTNMTWLGGLAIGGGEALFRGQPFEETKRNGPPVVHVQRALDLAASALAGGWPIPNDAIKLMKKSPIPMLPFRWWRRLFIKIANEHWRRGAAEHQIDSEAMQARPYAPSADTSSVP